MTVRCGVSSSSIRAATSGRRWCGWGGLLEVSAVVDLRRGSIRARSWSKPSAAARPAVASSQRACCGLLAGEAGDALEVVGEAGSALLRGGRGLRGLRAESAAASSRFVDGLLGEGVGEPVGGLADVEGDGRGVGGDDAARGGCRRPRTRRGAARCGPSRRRRRGRAGRASVDRSWRRGRGGGCAPTRRRGLRSLRAGGELRGRLLRR